MGYYTSFSLKWTSDNDDEELDTAIGNVIEAHPDAIGYALLRCGSTSESCKWYEHEEDMKTLSIRFPGVLFTLSGDGEESGDIWKKYFLDGKMQICKAILTFPEFSARLLQ